MKPTVKAYNFINDHIDILNSSIEEFLNAAYIEKLENRYVREIVEMCNDAGIETVDYQWKLFVEKFTYFERYTKDKISYLDHMLNMFNNFYGLSYYDIKNWLLTDSPYSLEWAENINGDIVRI